MSNLQKNSTKLRGNETLKNHCQYKPNYDSASGTSQHSNPKIISEPKRQKYGGRGMAIQELAKSMSSNNMKIPNLNFSNTCIENHFKSLREENAKKIKETNEKIWGKFIHSEKNA